MDSLKFSAIDPQEPLPTLLARFDLPCHLEEMTWGDAWEKMSRITLHGTGPDVSQVGTSWLDGLVASGAVRPFRDEEIEKIGGASVFFPASWQTVSPPLWRRRVWAIPWLADVRLVFYWRDMLEAAGVDGETAFQTPERVEETMQRLQTGGIDTPWGVWAVRMNVTLQNACSWVWGGGGEITSANGREIKFDQTQAMNGLVAYLRLHRYMPPSIDRLVRDPQVVEQFVARRVAVVMGPCLWLKQMMDALERSPGLADRIGVALPPGPAFVGGSHFVMWSHTHRVCESVALLQFLISKQAQLEYCYATGFLPVRPDVLAGQPYTTDARYQVVVEALRTGRTFPVIPKWGDIEERLGHGLVWLWDNLLSDPDQDLETLVRPYIEATARRLSVTLGVRR